MSRSAGSALKSTAVLLACSVPVAACMAVVMVSSSLSTCIDTSKDGFWSHVLLGAAVLPAVVAVKLTQPFFTQADKEIQTLSAIFKDHVGT